MSLWLLKCSPLLFKQVTNYPFTQLPLTRRGVGFFPLKCETLLVVFLDESIYCAVVVVGAEVGADTVSCFGGGSAVQVSGRQAGLCLVTVAGAAVEACVFCIQVLLSKVWVLLRKASELICGKTTRGRQRQRQYETKALKKCPETKCT